MVNFDILFELAGYFVGLWLIYRAGKWVFGGVWRFIKTFYQKNKANLEKMQEVE